MNDLPLEKDIIVKRLEGIEAELTELHRLARLDLSDFSSGDGWKVAQFHLHRALEGVFNISSHILSRIPGAQASQYREIALKMGEYKIVPPDFAQTKLVQMAKYRNRLVHFYAQVGSEELYRILQNDLGDFDTFLSAVKNLLLNPAALGLRVA